MADPSRFPRLAPPFALVGAAAGWLSAGLLANPLVAQLRRDMQLATMIVACALAAGTGALLRHWCAGRRYGYQLAIPDPNVRLPTDVWWRHAVAMIATGTLTGTFIGGSFNADDGVRGAIIGTLCALVFLPVGFAVLSSARRAQRARLGSIVAASDRRAVVGILAASLGVATFEAAPDWAAWDAPIAAVVMWSWAFVVVVLVTVVDERARRMLGVVVRDLEARPDSSDAPDKIDLGVGDEVAARLERSISPYRGSDRTLALVHGDPRIARGALRRAVLRGGISLLALGMVAMLHAAANTSFAHRMYEEIVMQPRCRGF
jgi:hypothetical protein